MSKITESVMRRFYRKAAGDPSRLPWHRNEPSQILISAVGGWTGQGRALDLGCGAGVLAIWLAKQGMQVTGIDLFPEAITMARSLADRENVRVEFETADIFAYTPDRHFDLVYDSGCLHSLVGGNVESYKRQVLSWLAPAGDFVLEHWGKRHALDWRPIGPKRRSRATIERLFGPELTLAETEVNDFSAPLPFGPVVRGLGYWFRRVQ